jgi:UDP-galactopyranose mutase
VQYDKLPQAVGVADVALNPFGDSIVTHCALPGKVLQYMACGLPTISTPLRGLESVVGQDGGVLFRPPHEQFVRAAVDLLDNAEAAEAQGRTARAVLERTFRWSDCIARFEHRLEATVEDYQARRAARGHG